ncbi:class I SAM-dependent rRNA methyltransferase [Candidatus Endomicrobiellum devescovinae]|jgi:23S rRNA (cytosine1962-C5)-methyltransferase|uniref:class I SAM-dependent rRNA methyltransferase n=1 Tax=Candidatus Endomicrobiellum devescovinae TaxID=3242322 RepID=UPI002822C38B|nr:class I SAM-dependent rRNA methyltransferase [Endomicrobium sp.]
MKRIVLKAGDGKRIKNGHKWVFSNEVKQVQGTPLSGDIVSLYDNAENFIGLGFYNPNSLISFRLLTNKEEKIDILFWQKRIEDAKILREVLYPNEISYRVVFGESDNISGVILDKYEDYLCAQFVSYGAEKCKKHILEAAKNVFNPKGIFIRNDVNLRKLEGLSLENEIYFGDIPKDIIISENSIKFYADIVNGQKTGFFFDQRDNRQKFSAYSKCKKVLDCFCHTGAFGIYAKKYLAKDVIFVDSSRLALEMAEKNYELNDFKNFNGLEADALEYLNSQEAKDEKFDLVNIDPPGLIKNRKDFNAGFKHYVKINESAMKLLNNGGILTTSSCSHHLGFREFKDAIHQAAAKAKKTALILEYGFQSKDHPILASMPETEYLNFAVVLLNK